MSAELWVTRRRAGCATFDPRPFSDGDLHSHHNLYMYTLEMSLFATDSQLKIVQLLTGAPAWRFNHFPTVRPELHLLELSLNSIIITSALLATTS